MNPTQDASELDQLKAESANMESELKARRATQALETVTAAIARGAIVPRNTALKSKWLKLCEEDPQFIRLLNSTPGNPALTQGRITASTKPI